MKQSSTKNAYIIQCIHCTSIYVYLLVNGKRVFLKCSRTCMPAWKLAYLIKPSIYYSQLGKSVLTLDECMAHRYLSNESIHFKFCTWNY